MYLFLITTLLSFLTFNIGDIVRPLSNWAYKATAKERELLKLKADLKVQQSELSIVDEFAKYSKIQRKINVIDQELQELQSQRAKNNIVVRMFCTYGARVLIGVMLTFLSIYYRNTPLIVLDNKIDLFPLTGLISYPTGVQNSVSVPFWIMCCTSVGRLIKINE